MIEREREDRDNTPRITIPDDCWMPLGNEFIDQILPALKRRRSAHVYLAMYQLSRKHKARRFAANLTDLAKLTGRDPRTVRDCVIELCQEGFVKITSDEGPTRSRTTKTIFRVPGSELELKSGNWFPVPTFLVTKYLPTFAGSLLLVPLLYYQHLQWKRFSWVGIATLHNKTRWPVRTIYDALNRMAYRRKWESQNTGLPKPLTISVSPDGERRRFSVSAVNYYRPDGQKKTFVSLSREFSDWYRTISRPIFKRADPDSDESYM